MSDDTSIYEGLNLDISIDEYLDPKFVSNTLSADSLANDNLQSSHRLELVTLVVKRLFENCLPYGIQSVSYLEKQGYAFCDDDYTLIKSHPSESTQTFSGKRPNIKARDPELEHHNISTTHELNSTSLGRYTRLYENTRGTGNDYLIIDSCLTNCTKSRFIFDIKNYGSEAHNLEAIYLEAIYFEAHKADLKLSLKKSDRTAALELSSRPADVLKHVINGKNNSEIAEQLNISVHTVNAYIKSLYLKTGTDNRVSLSLFAVGLNHI